jgi:hypothetical protein
MSQQKKHVLQKLQDIQDKEIEVSIETSEGLFMGTVKEVDLKDRILLLQAATQLMKNKHHIEHIAPVAISFEMIDDISIIT